MIVLLAVPTYGPNPDPRLDKARRAALMYSSNKGIKWMGDISLDRMGWASMRNKTAEKAIEARDSEGNKADGLLWCDDDILVPPDSFYRLISHGKDMVSALYFSRAEPHHPVAGTWYPETETFSPMVDYEENVIAPMDGVGFGCVYTSIKLLEAVFALPDPDTRGPFGGNFDNRTFGEDYLFCIRARLAGFQPYVDTGVKCGHYLAPRWASEKLYRAFVPKGVRLVK